MNIEKIVNIKQKEYAFTWLGDSKPVLSTANVACCTVLSGYENKLKFGFLCHFDFPCSSKSISELISNIERINLPDDHLIEARLEGGWCFLWSPCTRHKIRRNIETTLKKKNINIIISEGKFNTFKTKSFELNTATGDFKIFDNKAYLKNFSNNFGIINRIHIWLKQSCFICFNKQLNLIYFPEALEKMKKL